MLTKKLHNAFKETEKICDFLEKREWNRTDELIRILDKAEREIKAIQDKAVGDVLAKLQGPYLKAVSSLSDDSSLSKREQAQAQTELKRIQKAINKLVEVM